MCQIKVILFIKK